MSATLPPAIDAAQLAKAALRRLAVARLEPTPENYARAYAEEAGGAPPPLLPARPREVLERLVGRLGDDAAAREAFVRAFAEGRWDEAVRSGERLIDGAGAQAHAWAQTIDRIARHLDRGGRQWTAARKKESLQRVLESSGSDLARLQHRLRQLIGSWEQGGDDTADAAVPAADAPAPAPDAPATAPAAPAVTAPAAPDWPPVLGAYAGTVEVALRAEDAGAVALADELQGLAGRIAGEGVSAGLAAQVDEATTRARRWLAHRHHLLDELSGLCRELSAGLVDLAEDDSWAKGQCENLEARLADGLNARSVRAAADLLAKTRERQQGLRGERERARSALKTLIRSLMDELGELDQHTDRFESHLGRYADAIEAAETLDGLAGVVQEMVSESRAVREQVSGARKRLHDDRTIAFELEQRVRTLEAELRQLSEEVSTDALTQVANRRGLLQAFEAERARLERVPEGEDAALGIGLIDIDNFKKLNDTLGHAAGDLALKSLAARVRESLRPVDAVARYGGEEFVVLLPGTPADQAQQVLTRLQRSLSASLFMHENREVLVTFSAGVTAYRPGEPLETALQRADEALYEAKRTGKNRTCIG